MDDLDGPSVQDRHAPRSICFGCGPANPEGLHLRSYRVDGELVARWQARPAHQAFPGVLNGGIVGALLDCHANWASALALMERAGHDRPPATVTADFEVRMLRPTPADRPLELRARVSALDARRARADAELSADGQVTATFRGTFVAVPPGHPAYHRWD